MRRRSAASQAQASVFVLMGVVASKPSVSATVAVTVAAVGFAAFHFLRNKVSPPSASGMPMEQGLVLHEGSTQCTQYDASD